jgi:hypothetical protein
MLGTKGLRDCTQFLPALPGPSVASTVVINVYHLSAHCTSRCATRDQCLHGLSFLLHIICGIRLGSTPTVGVDDCPMYA